MSMQIKAIILYNKSGDTRVLRFELGKVNIIRGASGTGKSAVIRIIEYCLGQSDFKIPGKHIRDTVEWYSVLYQIGDKQLFVAKPPPTDNGTKYTKVYYQIDNINIETPPKLLRNMLNASDTEISVIISELIWTSINASKALNTQETLVSKAKFCLFQDFDTVANSQLLFHRQYETAKEIRKSLPYFLGIESENDLNLQKKIAQAKNELDRVKREKREAEHRNKELYDMGQNLINEAKSVGLPAESFELINEKDIGAILKILQDSIKDWQPDIITPIFDDRLPQLNHQEDELKREFDQINAEIYKRKKYRSEISGYSQDVDEQRMRLESINLFVPQNVLFDELDAVRNCPLCNLPLVEGNLHVPKISDIRKVFNELETNKRIVEEDTPRLNEQIERLERQLEVKRQQLVTIKTIIKEITQEQNNFGNILQQIRDTNSQISRVVHRIEMYPEIMQSIGGTSELQKNIEIAQKLLEEYESQLDEMARSNNERRIMAQLNEKMTQWANDSDQLDLMKGRYSLDIKGLTVLVDTDDRTYLMDELGEKNPLGCHLITHMALHKHFVDYKRPIPNFLILDQPAQGYFTTEESKRAYQTMGDNIDSKISIDDMADVERMFNFLFDVCEDLAPNFQVIVLEHADIPGNKRFQEAVLSECPWTTDNALIPQSWFKENLQPRLLLE